MRRRRLVAGESLDRAISASTWNDLLSLLDHRDANGLWLGSTQQQPAARMNRPGVVYIRNNTGSNLSQFSIVGIGGPAIDSNVTYGEFQREVILSATTPGATHYGKFAVTIDAIPVGECGLACVSGVVQCKVDLDEEAHRYADLEVGNVGALVSRQSGSAEILWRLAETGDGTWCIVRLGNSRYAVRKATASASIAAGASGNVAIKTDGKDDETATAYYTWADDGGPTIDNGDEIYVAWIDDERKWYILPPASAGTAGRNRCVMVGDSGYYGWRDGDGATSARPIIGWNGTNSKTVKLFPTMNGFTGNSEGAVYTVKSAPVAFTDDWLTLKQDGRYCITFTHVWGLPSLGSSDANTYLRAAAHDHSYTDDGTPMTTGTATPQAQSLTRKLVGIEARVDLSAGADVFETSTAEQMYYAPGTAPDDEARVWSTIVAYVRRNGADVGVNLLLTKIHGANESRPYHVNQFVKIEQTSDA